MIVAIDPGGTTGFSGATDDGLLVFADQLPPFEFQEWLYAYATALGPLLHLVVERFTITQRTIKLSRAGSYDAIEVIGHARWVSHHFCDRDITMQQPADVMNLFPDARLKALGWHQKGRPHANDSLRHLAWYLAQAKVLKIPPLR
jgi:hypothetical protein